MFFLNQLTNFCNFSFGKMAISYQIELKEHAQDHMDYIVILRTKNRFKTNSQSGYYSFTNEIHTTIQDSSIDIDNINTKIQNIRDNLEENMNKDNVQYEIAYFKNKPILVNLISSSLKMTNDNNQIEILSNEDFDLLFNKILSDIIEDLRKSANQLQNNTPKDIYYNQPNTLNL